MINPELQNIANEITNETRIGANTAQKIGALFSSLIEKILPVDDIAQSAGTSTSKVMSQAAVRTFVYAIRDAILKGSGFNLDSIQFNPATETLLTNIGQIRWNADNQTLEIKCSNDVTLSIGQENYIRGKNAEATQILNGKAVYVSGGQGANALIKRASNNNTTGERVIGVATQNIDPNNIGFITTNGIVNEINTSAFAEGDVLWLGVDGALTNVKPGTEVNQIIIGVVLRSHATQGSLLVSVKDDWRDQVAQLRSDLSKLNSVVNGGTYPLFTMQGNGTDIYIPRADFEREESSFYVSIKVTNPPTSFAQYGFGLSADDGNTYTYKAVVWDDLANGIGHVEILPNTTHLVITSAVKDVTYITFYSNSIEGVVEKINNNELELISQRSDLNEKNYYALKAPQSITEQGGGYYPYKFQHGLTYRVITSGDFIEEAYLAINYITPQVQKINFYNGISIFTCNNSSIGYINTLGISGISFEVEIVEPITTSLNDLFAKKYLEYIGNGLNQHIPLTTFGLTSPTKLLFRVIDSPPNFATVGLSSSDGVSLILYLPVTWIEYNSVNRSGIGYVNVPSGVSHIAISSANTAYTHIFFYTATTSILLYQEIERAKLAEQSILNNIQNIEAKLLINNYISQSSVSTVDKGEGYYPYPFLLNKHYRITISDGTLSGDVYIAKSALEPRVQQLIFFEGVCFFKCNYSGCDYIYASSMLSSQFTVEEMSSYDDIISKKVELPSDGYGLAGKVLQTNGDGTTNWSEVGSPTNSQVDNAVNGWFLENQEKVLGIESIRELNSQKYHNNGCIVSFIDDDTSQYVGNIWGEILSSTNIKMGFACVTGMMEGSVTTPAVLTPMPLVDLKSLYDSGHDVYSHSHSHPAFYSDTTTVEMVDDECRLSKQWLDLNGFTRTSDIIVYPGGLGQSRVSKKDSVRKYFRYGVDTVGSGINPEPLDNWCVYRQNADTADLETLKAKVDEAYNANGLLVFMNHSYELYNGTSGRTRDEEVAKMIALIEYIKGKGIQILPLSEALYRKGNIIAQGEYTESDAYFVSKTGKKTGAGSSFIREGDIINITPLVGTSYSAYGGCYYYIINNKIHFHFGLSGLTPQANNRVYIVTSLGVNFSPIRDVVATGKGGTSFYQCSICTISTTGAVDISSFDSYAEIDIEYPLKM